MRVHAVGDNKARGVRPVELSGAAAAGARTNQERPAGALADSNMRGKSGSRGKPAGGFWSTTAPLVLAGCLTVYIFFRLPATEHHESATIRGADLALSASTGARLVMGALPAV